MGLAWFDISFWDLWKAIAIALTGLFGIMGLLTNYKDRETGRITVWGRINMAGILLSATMGVLSQLVDAQNKVAAAQRSAIAARRSADLAARTSTQAQAAATQARSAATNTARLIGDLVAVSRRTAAIAHGTERSVANSRAAAGAGQEAAARTLVVARGTAEAVQASKAGLVRVERLLSPFDSPTLVLLVGSSAPDRFANACPTKEPKASAWFRIFSTDTGAAKEVAFYEGEQGVTYSAVPGIAICRIEIPLKAAQTYGIYSYLDLPAKRMQLELFDLDARFYTINSCTIRTRDGQEVRIPMDDATLAATDVEGSLQRAWSLTYTFPAGRDPRFTGR